MLINRLTNQKAKMEETYKNLTIKIEQELDALNPRKEWDHIGTMACFHSRHCLGDKHTLSIEECTHIEEDTETYISLPLYLYDHSGITMKTSPFGCSWDSGKVGIIFAPRSKAKDEGITEKQLLAALETEVKEYDMYLTGDVWWYSIETEDGESVDSCGGFYGYEYCLQEAKEQAKYWHKELAFQAKVEKQTDSWYKSML